MMFDEQTALWLSFGDNKKVYSQPQRQYKQLIAKRPRGMRIGDFPEYLLSLGLLSITAKYSNVPTNIILSGVSSALIAALILHRPVQRFRYMWRLTFFMWTIVFGFSSLTQYIAPKSHWSLIPVGYIGGLMSFYLWHITAHQTWTGRMYKVHMRHHMETYPPKKFLADKRRADHDFLSIDGLFHEGPLYFIILIELGILKYLYRDDLNVDKSLAMLLLGLGLFGSIGNQLHYAFHLRGHWLEQMDWFLMLRELHWVHHKGDMQKNYMLLNFAMDELFSSKDYVRYINERNAGTYQPRINDKTN